MNNLGKHWAKIIEYYFFEHFYVQDNQEEMKTHMLKMPFHS
jgi:hypothetical protein